MSLFTKKYTRYLFFALIVHIYVIFDPSNYVWAMQLLIFAILIDFYMGRDRIKSIEDTYNLDKAKRDIAKGE